MLGKFGRVFDFNLRLKRVEIPQTFGSYRVPTGSSLVQSLELERSASATSLPVAVQYSPYVLPGFTRRAVERNMVVDVSDFVISLCE